MVGIQGSDRGFFAKRLGRFVASWRIYFSHEVRNAGIGLACLYMTVLGFDSITMGYSYSQGVPESILGILLAVGAAIGLLGSVAFPSFVRCLGVERTGNKNHSYFWIHLKFSISSFYLDRFKKDCTVSLWK